VGFYYLRSAGPNRFLTPHAMKVEAVSSKRVGGRFNVPGPRNILEFPFDLDLIRGEMQSSSTELPGGGFRRMLRQ
jgi:hypothetical protein